MNREEVVQTIDTMLTPYLQSLGYDIIVMRVPQGIAILQPTGKHLLIRVNDATIETV